MSGRGGGRGGRGQKGGGGPSGEGPPRGGHGQGGDRGAGGRGRRPGPSQPAPVYLPTGQIESPDKKVTELEDKFEKALQKGTDLPDLGALSLDDNKKVKVADKSLALPARPGFGTRGKHVTLLTNYFQFIANDKLKLHRYSISVRRVDEGDTGRTGRTGPSGKKLQRIIELLLEEPELRGHKDKIVTDFAAMLISVSQFEDIDDRQITYRAEFEDTPPETRQQVFAVSVKRYDSVTIGQLTSYLTSTNATETYPERLQTVQALNVFLRHYAKAATSLTAPGKAKTFPLEGEPNIDIGPLGAGLVAIKGFFSSVRLATARILVNVNVTNGAFYQANALRMTMERVLNENHNSLGKLEAFLKRLRVEVLHLKARKNKAGQVIPRIKTIFGFASVRDGGGDEHRPKVARNGAGPKDVSFRVKDDSEDRRTVKGIRSDGYISVFDWFKSKYRMNLDDTWPVVNVGNKDKPSYLPAEVCKICPGQAYNRKLNPDQTAQMIRFAVKPPSENARKISQAGPNIVGLLPGINAKLGQFGININVKLLTVPGRVLVGPAVKYQGKTMETRFASWNLVDVKYPQGIKLERWTYVEFYFLRPGEPRAMNRAAEQKLGNVVENFRRTCNAAGMNLFAPEVNTTRGQRAGIQSLDDVTIERALNSAPIPEKNQQRGRFVLVILPNKDAALYNKVKQICDVKLGIQSVCAVSKSFMKDRNEQTFANISLKVNLKFGGINHFLEDTKLGIIKDSKTMIVGIDVTHPSPGSASNAPSIAAMVASTNKTLGQWPGIIKIQRSAKREMVQHLVIMLETRLDIWKRVNKVYPENILVYRDGVSEGQYDLVLENELPQLNAACRNKIGQGKLPKITVIIVGKRHHTRFYPTKSDDTERSGNTKPGTVVDRGITEARNWDFFLQAHSALQGTARPAHYYVIHDEIFRSKPGPGNTADVVEDLTHNLCYLYGRATKAVSICPPAYYADLLCERARRYLSHLFELDTPGGSEAGSIAGDNSLQDPTEGDVLINHHLSDTMFYI